MNKIIASCLVIMLGCLVPLSMIAQEKTSPQTKFEQFLSKTGQIIRFEDSKLSPIKTNYSLVEVRIRKFTAGSEIKYFYQISTATKYGTKTASLVYDDLLEVLKAVDVLIASAGNDKTNTFDYLESKFVADGFEIGYYKDKSNITWYMDLAKYGSDGLVWFKKPEIVKQTMSDAKIKADQLMGNTERH